VGAVAVAILAQAILAQGIWARDMSVLFGFLLAILIATFLAAVPLGRQRRIQAVPIGIIKVKLPYKHNGSIKVQFPYDMYIGSIKVPCESSLAS
jgi:hypothetical protein